YYDIPPVMRALPERTNAAFDRVRALRHIDSHGRTHLFERGRLSLPLRPAFDRQSGLHAGDEIGEHFEQHRHRPLLERKCRFVRRDWKPPDLDEIAFVKAL